MISGIECAMGGLPYLTCMLLDEVLRPLVYTRSPVNLPPNCGLSSCNNNIASCSHQTRCQSQWESCHKYLMMEEAFCWSSIGFKNLNLLVPCLSSRLYCSCCYSWPSIMMSLLSPGHVKCSETSLLDAASGTILFDGSTKSNKSTSFAGLFSPGFQVPRLPFSAGSGPPQVDFFSTLQELYGLEADHDHHCETKEGHHLFAYVNYSQGCLTWVNFNCLITL